MLNKAVGSRIGVFFFLGVIYCFLVLFVPNAEDIFVFELRAVHHAHAPRVVTPHLHTSPHLHIRSLHLSLAHHQFSSTEKIESINQRTGLGTPNNTIIFSSVFGALFLQAYQTVACVCLQSYRLCLHRVIRKRAYERTPAKS